MLIGSLSLTDHSIERSKTEDDTNSAVFNVFSSVGWHNKLTIYRRNSYSHLWFRICDTTWLFTMTRPDHYGVFINAVFIYKKTATNNSHKLLIMSLILSLSFSLHFALEWWSADSWKMMWLSIIYYFWPMAWYWKSPNQDSGIAAALRSLLVVASQFLLCEWVTYLMNLYRSGTLRNAISHSHY